MHRSPSIKTLKKFILDLQLDISAYKFKKILQGTESDNYKELWKDNYHDPTEFEKIMKIANKLIEGHGIEAIRGKWISYFWQDSNALYINMGDTYIPTILYDVVTDCFRIMSWGDYVEWKKL